MPGCCKTIISICCCCLFWRQRGNTNNNIGTWADAYAENGGGGECFNSMYRWEHASHNTTSAITYKIFVHKQTNTGFGLLWCHAGPRNLSCSAAWRSRPRSLFLSTDQKGSCIWQYAEYKAATSRSFMPDGTNTIQLRHNSLYRAVTALLAPPPPRARPAPNSSWRFS